MAFDPSNHVIKLCIQGMMLEEKNLPEAALRTFLRAWDEATNDFEKYLAAYYVSRHQSTASDTLEWLETALDRAWKVPDRTITSAFPALYSRIAESYDEIGDKQNANKYRELSRSSAQHPQDEGPFYHGTKADLKVGDSLTPGFGSNYQPGLSMNHIYFTALPNGAGLAAALANGDGPERVYIVEPTGSFESDPNVTDKKFPGNPTRSYRTASPLTIVGELTDWVRQTPEQIRQWKQKLQNNKGEIIN